MFWMSKSVPILGKKGDKGKKSINLSPIEVLLLIQLRSRELRNNGEPVGQYGYEMIQHLNVLFAGSWKAKSGTIYPILSKLEKNKKMIAGERKKSPLGPVKRVYILEDWGRECIDKLIYDKFQGDIEFLMNYMDLLTPFLTSFEKNENFDDIFDKMLSIPAKGVKIAMEQAITEVDKNMQRRKLETLQNHLELLIKDIKDNLKD